MAHELNIDKGRASMFYVGEVPWHRLGQRFTEPPRTSEEAIKAANLDWDVGLKPIIAADGLHFCEIPERMAVVRLDKWGKPGCIPFGLVGSDYQPLQNREAFAFFDGIVASGEVTFETAGALGDGERVWVLAKVAGEPEIAPGDRLQRYLLLSTGHDGKTAVEVRFTPIRVVCQNTLSWAQTERRALFRMHHNERLHRRMKNAVEAAKSILDEFQSIEVDFRRLVQAKCDDTLRVTYLEAVFPKPKRRANERDDTYEKRVMEVRERRGVADKLALSGRGNDVEGVRGTLWAAYNGVTEYVDHFWRYRSPEQRLNFLWFGEGENIKTRALNEALARCRN